jgi:flagellar hook protein FlgE
MNPDDGSFEYVGSAGQSTALLKITPKSSDYGDSFTSIVNGEKVDGVTVDFSNLTCYQSKTSGKSTATIVRGSTASEGAGRSMGTMNDVSIDTSGKIYGVYSNGETKLLGQIAVATFTNPMALEAVGSSMYTTTQNSGEFDGIGSAVDEDGGSMSQGVLEMSNVDLSTEFTEMITTQRGFQANSRIITTSDSMLEELVNLKR